MNHKLMVNTNNGDELVELDTISVKSDYNIAWP